MRRPPGTSITIIFMPGLSAKRARTSAGITTWSFGETVTVDISVLLSDGHWMIDPAPVGVLP